VDNFLRLENRHTGEILQMRRVHDAQGQVVLTVNGSLPQGSSGPPLHVHLREHEEFIVKAGTLGAQVGTKEIVVPAGGTAVLPAGLPHRWWNAGNDLLEFSGQIVPAVDLDRHLQAVFAVMNASASGKPSVFYLAHVVWRNRRTQALAMPPRAIQRILLPLVVVVGRILGKYRGEGWPGSPASCPGAPDVGAAT
jgi:mannose-6-phosphate isomerase-like protein (cupin superfamily)